MDMKRLGGVAVTACVLAALSGCGSGSGGGVEARSETTGSPAVKASALELGKRFETSGGNSAIAHAYKQPFSAPDRVDLLDAGNEFASVDVEVCAGANTTNAVTTPDLWQLEMPDNRRPKPLTYALPIRDPEFPNGPLAAGECVRGWVTFQAPKGVRASDVVLASTNPAGKWTVPSK